jgi:hypothetical protein
MACVDVIGHKVRYNDPSSSLIAPAIQLRNGPGANYAEL